MAIARTRNPNPVNCSFRPAAWLCAPLASFYKSQWRRMSPLLGWMENCTVEVGVAGGRKA